VKIKDSIRWSAECDTQTTIPGKCYKHNDVAQTSRSADQTDSQINQSIYLPPYYLPFPSCFLDFRLEYPVLSFIIIRGGSFIGSLLFFRAAPSLSDPPSDPMGAGAAGIVMGTKLPDISGDSSLLASGLVL
jgi:hypothetical protein